MRRSFLLVCAVLVLTGLPARRVSASAPPRIVRAATSQNGNFLVISSYELGPEGLGGGRAVFSDTFEVSKREPFTNPRDKLVAPNSYYYTDFGWKVVLFTKQGLSNVWPILSDDGETLILIGVGVAMEHETILAIYRKHQNGGLLVRSLKKEDLFRRRTGEPSMVVIWDSTPAWFATSRFAFSKDGATLFYSDPRHGKLKIRLCDGAVTW